MRSSLRYSANLAGVSRRSIEIGYRSHLQYTSTISGRSASLHAVRCRRHYATNQPQNPKEPKDKEDEAKNTSSNEEQNHIKGKDAPQSKPAPGFEQLYSKSSPMSKSSENKESSAPEQFRDSSLSKEDEKVLNELLAMLSRQMPTTQREDFLKAVEQMKKVGIPDELKDIIKVRRGQKSFNLATAAKVIRIVTKLARQAAEVRFNRETGGQNPEQKAGAHDPGPRDNKNNQENQNQNQNQNKDQDGKGFPGGKIFGGAIKLDLGTTLTTAFVSYMLYRTIMPSDNRKELTWQEIRTKFLDRGLVEKFTVVNGKQVRVTMNREAVRSVYPDSPAAHSNFYYYFSIGDVSSFERRLDQAQDELEIPNSQRIAVSYSDEISLLGTFLYWGPYLLLFGLPFYLLRKSSGGGGGSGGLFGMTRSRAKQFNHESDVKVAFKDVAGMDEAKLEIMEFVSFLKEPGIYHKLGAKIPRGAILSGPPGTGKTLLAKATAGESKVPFFSVSGSEFVEMFVGVGAGRVRDLFSTARKNAPSIIFIDEIDAIGKSRAKASIGGGSDEREATLNQILTEMDGFNTSEQVVVLAGTNRADVLDKALIRPGRFDRHISIDRPTMEGRKQIFEVHLKKIVTKEDPDHLQGRLAALTPGFAGADIANCVNEAALIAARNKAESVTMQHFEQAIERVIGGLEKKSLVLSPEEKKTVAYHEAGHAIAGWFFKYADPLLKVSIIPRGQGALGYAQYLPNGESYLMNVNQLMDRMAMTLAGRVSEELHFETVTSGASDDFNKVTRMATAMVTKWGMSDKVGYIYFEDDPQQQLHKPFSEDTAKNIDLEVRRIVDEAYKQCKDLLIEKKKEVGLVAEELLKKEVLSREDMVRILGPRPYEDNSNFTKYFGSRGDREGVAGSTPPSEDRPAPEDGLPPIGGGPAPTAFTDLR